MGKSSKGWSNVGIGLSESFAVEIDNVMSNITQQLTDGIEQIQELEDMLDLVLSTLGYETEEALYEIALAKNNSNGNWNSHGGNSFNMHEHLNKALRRIPKKLLKGDPLKDIGDIVKGAADAVADANGDPAQTIKAILDVMFNVLMSQLNNVIDGFLDTLEPAFLMVGKWYITFGDKIQAGIELFSVTVDTVEKLIDQIMAQSGGGGEGEEYMVEETYALFAISDPERGITVKDLQDIASMYEITSLQGSKSEDIHAKYDADHDAVIDQEEYALLVTDETIPGVMAVVLRSYAKSLAQVSGLLEKAHMRDEVANSLSKYLQLECGKNMTKAEWIAERLTNASVPMAFTACTMKNLAMAVEDPEVPETQDVGAVFIEKMTAANHDYTMESLELMSDAEWWESEGFDPMDQPVCVQRVTEWIGAAFIQTGSSTSLTQLHSMFGGQDESRLSLLSESREGEGGQGELSAVQRMGKMAREVTERGRKKHQLRRHKENVARYEALTSSKMSRVLFNHLLGGQMATHEDPGGDSAIHLGQPAVPETLEFAAFLSTNMSLAAAEYQTACFNYSGMSSTPADAFATQIEGMIKKTQGFMSMMDEYAGEEGMARLRNKTHEFVESAKNEAEDVIIRQLGFDVGDPAETADADVGDTAEAADADAEATDEPATEAALVQVGQGLVQKAADDPEPGSGVWMEMIGMLQTVQAILPEAIDNLKIARSEVSKVAKILQSVFVTFQKKGLPIFYMIASYYRLAWGAWFTILASFTLIILYYGFYASGMLGSISEEPDPEYEPPTNVTERIVCICRTCYICCRDIWRGECCFWSWLFLGQIFVLVIFLMSLLLTIIAGVELFVSSGCAAIYMLGDQKACTETLKSIRKWIESFDAGSPELDIEEVCQSNDLMTCKIIAGQLQTSAVMTVGGGLVAAVLSFQLLIECAIIHERIRNRRIIDGLLRKAEKQKEDKKSVDKADEAP